MYIQAECNLNTMHVTIDHMYNIQVNGDYGYESDLLDLTRFTDPDAEFKLSQNDKLY